ncbi:imidazolonepropionase [Woodsholea maritima]|uniref:imidazolonepropionase n=1 Tax=Woodsholea maritima TaxID=240237 RepID=UPI000364C797|nr:imidazolonepropionase [Woodsholea maritima]
MTGRVLTGARLATLVDNAAPYGLIDKGAIAVKDGSIVWVGAQDDLPEIYQNWPREDHDGRLITPAFVDCHTHLVFGGDRAREFEMRLEGRPYSEIAKAGGGILSTVKATRDARVEDLVTAALPRLDALLGEGVATIEIKSGYGLSVESELNLLRAARQLESLRPVRIKTTYLAAHAIPPEYKGRGDDYITDIVLPGMIAGHQQGLIDAVDGFCESIAFSVVQMERVFDQAQALGLPIKLHAEQLTNQRGAIMAARRGALSAEHLEYLCPEGVGALAAAGTVAVLLPGAFYTLRESQKPPVAALREAGVAMAIATDCNPGSSPVTSPLLMLNMACTLFHMTPEEALKGMTVHAAKALGLAGEVGQIAPGQRADLAIWNAAAPIDLIYRLGFNPLHSRLYGGSA